MEQAESSIVDFLRAEGAADVRHKRATLLDHLVGTCAIVRRWGQPAWLQRAALIHSVYGTDTYHRQLLPFSRRPNLAKLAGDQAERLAYLFCVTPRDLLLGDSGGGSRAPSRDAGGIDRAEFTRAERDALVLLHMANLAEQVQADDGAPGRWLVRLAELAEHVIDSDAVSLPLFIAELAAFSEADESLTRQVYLDGLSRGADPETRASRLAVAAAACPVVAEPCVWQAHLSRSRADVQSARWWGESALKRLHGLGTAWDKRLTFDDWRELADALGQPSGRELGPPPETIVHPRALLEAVRESQCGAKAAHVPAGRGSGSRDPVAGRKRFDHYIEALARAGGPISGAIYPDLPSRPWYEAEEFPLARYLESHYKAIRAEILGLQSARFHRESEGIRRSGDWDVAFLYERGRRHDEVCRACPVTTRGIEAYPTIRTVAGLIYVSRMRGETHIAAHRGPTNLRLRCHLAIKVPDGDCAIRVGDQTRKWQEAKCLVFDDHFEHEAWNHTQEDRLVLIVDMWHPGLSDTEVALLEALQNYSYFHARKLNRYWAANAAAAREANGD